MQVLRRVNKEAIQRGCTVGFLGDFFDKVHSRGTLPVNILNELMRFFETEWKVPMVMIPGNHDYFDAAETEHGLTPFTYASKYITVHDNPVVIDRQLWVPWRRDVREIKRILEEHTDIDVIFGHFDIVGFKMSATRISTEGVNSSSFPTHIPVYSGHYHTPQVHNNIRYLGSPYQLSLAEAGDNKSLVLIKGDFEVDECIPIDIGIHQYKWTAHELMSRYTELKEGDVVAVGHSNGMGPLLQTLKEKGINVSIKRQLQEVATRIDDTQQMTPLKLLEAYAGLNSISTSSDAYSLLTKQLSKHTTTEKISLRNVRPVSMIVSGFGPFTGPVQIALEGQSLTLVSGECDSSKTASNGAGKSLITAGSWLWACTGMIDGRSSLSFGKNVSIVNESSGCASVEVRGVVDGQNWSVTRTVDLKKKSTLTFIMDGQNRTRSTTNGTQQAIASELFGLCASAKGLYTWLIHNSVWSQRENTHWLTASDTSAKTEIRQLADLEVWTVLHDWSKTQLKQSNLKLSNANVDKDHRTKLYDMAISNHARNLRLASEWTTSHEKQISREIEDIKNTTIAYEKALLSCATPVQPIDEQLLHTKRRELIDAKVVVTGMKTHLSVLKSALPDGWETIKETSPPPKSEKTTVHKHHCFAAKHAREIQLTTAKKELSIFKQAGKCHTCHRPFDKGGDYDEHVQALNNKIVQCQADYESSNQMYQTACQQWTTAITMEANYKKNCEYVQKGQSLVKITERIRVAQQQMELLSTKVLELQTKHDKVRSAHAAWAQTTQLCQELKLSLNVLKTNHGRRREEPCPYDISDEIVKLRQRELEVCLSHTFFDECAQWKLITQWTGTMGIQTYALEHTVKTLAQRTTSWLQRFFKSDDVCLKAYFDEKERLIRSIQYGKATGVLSGGQFRRAQLAAFMAWRDMTPYDFPLLIMDEACTAMDIDGIQSVQSTLKDWCNEDENRTCFFISHEPEQHRDTSVYTNHTRILHKRGFSVISEEQSEGPPNKRQRNQ